MTNMCCLNNSIDMPYLSQTEKKKIYLIRITC